MLCKGFSRFKIGTSADCAEVPGDETALQALRSQANDSFPGSLSSAVSLMSFRRYSGLQKENLGQD